MRIDIITLFPEMFASPFAASIIKRALERHRVELYCHQLRQAAADKHHTVDDRPYGGGAGMVLKVDVIDQAIEMAMAEARKTLEESTEPWKILMTPQGKLFKQAAARELSNRPWLILICGRYEGFDERVRHLVDQEISIGDYILTGGELAAMVIIEATVRLIPGVLSKEGSIADESFETGILEYPHYTRPPIYKNMSVPTELLTGDHGRIEAWRRNQARERTRQHRPDLMSKSSMSEAHTSKAT